MEIVNWLEVNNLNFEFITESVFHINDEYFLALRKKDKIINEDFNVVVDDDEIEILNEYQIPYVAFYFGDCWYYTSVEGETKLNLLRYFGNAKEQIDFPFLGVHGKFELLNGSRHYEDWCKKAKFLGIKTLGLVEKSTLAGTMHFQEVCQKFNIKPILGQTAVVTNKEGTYEVKLFVKNRTGWKNLLKINKYQLVDNHEKKTIPEDELIKYGEGLIGVLTPSLQYKKWMVDKLKKSFDHIFYQLDTNIYNGEVYQKKILENTQHFLSNFKAFIDVVMLNDAYYLESNESELKRSLNSIGKINEPLSDDQHFKTIQEIEFQYQSLGLDDLFLEAVETAYFIEQECNFLIPTKNRYLPKYKMNEEEKKSFKDNEELFHHLVLEGFERKVYPKIQSDSDLVQKYLDRIDEESEILIEGNVADYFLILSDVCKWCKSTNILVGHGRGSAGGSLISYLLDIIEIDPIKYDLLFSRFLTRGRLKGSLPDLDIDFSDRDSVIRYMKQRYGVNYVASVATYGNLKVKNAIKDFSRLNGVQVKEANFITSIIPKDIESADFSKFLEHASKDKKIKNFIIENPKIFKFFNVVLHQTRTASVHACATIVVPTEDEEGNPCDIHDLLPTKIIDGQLVIEWEGGQLEKAGFLKEDILGLLQLEKFSSFLNLIEKNYNKKINLYDIDLEQKEVFDMFSKGLTEDVFQFGSDGLKGYCRYLKPNSIEELTAANALYRPGAMESNAHIDFVKIKFGEKSPEYDFLLEEVTKNTYGLYIYQEQTMKAYSIITGADLEQADAFRKYITKANKLKSKGIIDTEYEKYEKEFIESYVSKGQKPELAQKVWDKLLAFSEYGFNRSHAAAYAIISYTSQWFKVNYPVEFWTTSLNENKDKKIPDILGEIDKVENIKVYPVNINKSVLDFRGDIETNSIYWSINRVKFLGENGAKRIIEERNKNGEFFDIEEFYKRTKDRTLNKRSIENLILAGAFDEIYDVKNPKERLFILDNFYQIIGKSEAIEQFVKFNKNDTFWEIKQYELTGFGNINYKRIAENNDLKNLVFDLEKEDLESFCSVIGVVIELRIKNSPKIGEFAIVNLDTNGIVNNVIVWPDSYENNKEAIKSSEGQILGFDGRVKFDSFSKTKNLQTNRNSKVIFI